MVRRPANVALASVGAAVALAVAACGSPAADLFAVARSGAVAGADITVIASGDGTVRCDGHRHELPDPLLLTAENLADEITTPASKALRLRSGPHPVYTYVVDTPDGVFSYSDDSPHQGKVLEQLQAWVLTVVRTVCD
ncbi:MAG: hypothetical protein ABR947_04050 [Solirubrobacteraceae bacterium]|jgi:hypothetical protein